jgi:hypothetical protein
MNGGPETSERNQLEPPLRSIYHSNANNGANKRTSEELETHMGGIATPIIGT